MADKVTFFRRYPLIAGQKIHIEDGPRKGDWEVIAVNDKNVTLRCPFSGHVAEWARFCYLVDEREDRWPIGD